MVDAFRLEGAKDTKILLPRAARARELLPDELKKMGAQVDVVEVYRTVIPDAGTEEVRSMLREGGIHMVTFTSSSTVTNFISMFKEDGEQIKEWIAKTVVACIGPITARTAEEEGLKVGIIPEEYTIESLTGAIVRYFSESGTARGVFWEDHDSIECH